MGLGAFCPTIVRFVAPLTPVRPVRHGASLFRLCAITGWARYANWEGSDVTIVMLRIASIPILLCCMALVMAAPVSLFETKAPHGLDFVLQNSPTPQKYL